MSHPQAAPPAGRMLCCLGTRQFSLPSALRSSPSCTFPLRSSAHVCARRTNLSGTKAAQQGRPPRRLPSCVSALQRTCKAPWRCAPRDRARPFGMRRQPLGCTPCQPIAGRHLDGRHRLGCACKCPPPPHCHCAPLRCLGRPPGRLHLCRCLLHTCIQNPSVHPGSERAPLACAADPWGAHALRPPPPHTSPRCQPLVAICAALDGRRGRLWIRLPPCNGSLG